jgi:hypothetical protein
VLSFHEFCLLGYIAMQSRESQQNVSEERIASVFNGEE